MKTMAFLWFNKGVTPQDRKRVQLDIQQPLVWNPVNIKGNGVRRGQALSGTGVHGTRFGGFVGRDAGRSRIGPLRELRDGVQIFEVHPPRWSGGSGVVGGAWPNTCYGKPRKSGRPEVGDLPSVERTTTSTYCGV